MTARVTSPVIPCGFTFSATHCGLKKSKLDLALIVSESPAIAAAMFTTNQVKAAPVIVSQEHMRSAQSRIRAIIVNSGNANCCTGPEGFLAARATAAHTARELGPFDPKHVLVNSTGVIGAPLRVGKILAALPDLARARRASPGSFEAVARAIMTTDTRPKWAWAKFRARGKEIRILGCAKGSGMISPNMATMFAFLLTDAAIEPRLLSRALRTATEATFNSITVDGDTSTNDTIAVLANAQSGARKIRVGSYYGKFCTALTDVCKSLALSIVEDGEGAQRVIEIEVRGASSDRDAERIARTIANSPLVKTALAGADPNWGRILAAAGRSGVEFQFERADIWLAGILVCRGGREKPFDEGKAHQKMLAKMVPILVDLRSGRGKARMWTCDFTGEYVHINASYRT